MAEGSTSTVTVSFEKGNLERQQEEENKKDASLERLREYVRGAFSQHDSSHDYAHTQRVTKQALCIARESNLKRKAVVAGVGADTEAGAESNSIAPQPEEGDVYDEYLVEAAALSHDLYDHKYLPAARSYGHGSSSSSASSASSAPEASTFPDLSSLLTHLGFPTELISKLTALVPAVSWSYEKKHPGIVAQVLKTVPELGPVQDADRLDAIGARGLGRAFVYAASREMESKREHSSKERGLEKGGGGGGRGSSGGGRTGGAHNREANTSMSAMDNTRLHIDEKLLLIEQKMKTEIGRQIAKERTEFMRDFARRWDAED